MLVRGGIALVWPLLRLGPNHPEFQAQSAASRSGAHSRELILSVACIVAGVGLFWHHALRMRKTKPRMYWVNRM